MLGIGYMGSELWDHCVQESSNSSIFYMGSDLWDHCVRESSNSSRFSIPMPPDPSPGVFQLFTIFYSDATRSQWIYASLQCTWLHSRVHYFRWTLLSIDHLKKEAKKNSTTAVAAIDHQILNKEEMQRERISYWIHPWSCWAHQSSQVWFCLWFRVADIIESMQWDS